MKRAFLAILTVGLLSSCGNLNQSASSTQVEVQKIIGTNGELISILSDNVRAAGYEAISKTMTVQFKNGHTYEYYLVPEELWNSFIAAQPHPWSQIGYPRLVQGGYRYRRIG